MITTLSNKNLFTFRKRHLLLYTIPVRYYPKYKYTEQYAYTIDVTEKNTEEETLVLQNNKSKRDDVNNNNNTVNSPAVDSSTTNTVPPSSVPNSTFDSAISDNDFKQLSNIIEKGESSKSQGIIDRDGNEFSIPIIKTRPPRNNEDLGIEEHPLPTTTKPSVDNTNTGFSSRIYNWLDNLIPTDKTNDPSSSEEATKKELAKNTTQSLEEESSFRKIYETELLKTHNLNFTLSPDITQARPTEEYEKATQKVVASIATIGAILVESGKTLGHEYEVSQELDQQLKVEVKSFDDYIKSLSNTPYVKWAGAITGLGLIIMFSWKMGLLKKVPSLLGHLVDVMPSSLPTTPSGSSMTNAAVERTLNTATETTNVATIMDLLKSPAMPLVTIGIATVTLAGYIVLARSFRVFKLLRKIK